MEECRTPTYSDSTQFKFACTTPTNLDMQNMQNLMVSNTKKPRCYTPTTDTAFTSPCMSPIELEQTAENDQMNPASAAMPKLPMPKPPMMAKHHRTNIAPLNLSKGKMKPLSPLVMNAAAAAPPAVVSIVVTPNLNSSATDSSNSSGGGDKSMLDHTMTIYTMLQSIKMEQYADIFNDFTVENFLKMRKSDLQRFGLNSEEHCQKIMDMLKEFNNLSM